MGTTTTYSPRCQVPSGGESRHVGPDLGDDRLGRPLAHSGDGVEMITGSLERADDHLDPLVQLGDGDFQVAGVVQAQPDEQGVVVAEPPFQGLAKLRDLAP